MGQRLFYIHRAIVEILDAFPPGSVALERIHSHVRYPRTAILMAHARGAIMLAAAQRKTPVFGYAATRIKKTLTGNGRAPKAQIQHAIMTELGLDQLPEPHDVADACAAALCHFHVNRNQQGLEERLENSHSVTPGFGPDSAQGIDRFQSGGESVRFLQDEHQLFFLGFEHGRHFSGR